VPLSINPDGAFFFGFKVGRRSAELILVDFLGRPKAALRKSYPWPTPPLIIAFVQDGLEQMLSGIPGHLRDRVAGTWHRHTVRTLELGRAGRCAA
jgi:hypothetical protein